MFSALAVINIQVNLMFLARLFIYLWSKPDFWYRLYSFSWKIKKYGILL